MPRISGACSSVFCPLEDVSHIGIPDVWKVLRLSNRRVVDYFLRSVPSVFLLFFIFHSSLIGAYAQRVSATLSSTVTDQEGAVMSGVNVAVINNAQSFRRPARTSAEGTFVIPELAAGHYTTKAEDEPFTQSITFTPEVVVTPASPLNPQRANANYFIVDDVSVQVRANASAEPVLSTKNNVTLIVVKSRGVTPGAVQPELSSDHSVALWLVIIASIISLAFLLIRGLAKDLQHTILVLLRLWEKILKEKKRLKRLRRLRRGTNHRCPRTNLGLTESENSSSK